MGLDAKLIDHDAILQGLSQGLETCLWDQLRVLADRLEELGQEKLGQAYRWLAQEKLCPLRYAERWHWRQNRGPLLPLGHQLPDAVLAVMLRDDFPAVLGCQWNERDSLAEAYAMVALAITRAAQEGLGPLASPPRGARCARCPGQ
jgi:hypothetical protein